jgi:hypothetical protein
VENEAARLAAGAIVDPRKSAICAPFRRLVVADSSALLEDR